MEKVELSRLEKDGRNRFFSDHPKLGWKFGRLKEFEVPGLRTFRMTDTDGWVTNYAQENGDVRIKVFID